MKLIYKIFHQDPDSREGIITATSSLGIAVNVVLAIVKLIIGALANSIAIISEGVNGVTDVMSSMLALVGAKLASKHPDEKHPFGYGRIEYLTNLVVSVLILVSGAEVLKESVEQIFYPEKLKVNLLALIVVAVSAVVKFFLGLYTIRMGKKADSGSLLGVGLECRNDAFASLITILSAVIFLFFGFSIDAFAGILTSLIILKAGIDVLRETLSEILGRPGEKELAKELYGMIRQTDGVLNAADMMLHNYGPDRYSGSVNVEIDHGKTVEEIYKLLHALQLKIMREKNVTMVFGVYAVDNDREELRKMRKYIGAFVKVKDHVKSFHALYVEPQTDRIYVDLTVDYDLRDWNELRREFAAYMDAMYPGRPLELTVETEFV